MKPRELNTVDLFCGTRGATIHSVSLFSGIEAFSAAAIGVRRGEP